jgi:hypothetical protein
VELVADLARGWPDRYIAGILNRIGCQTGPGNSWSENRVRSFRGQHKIPVFVVGNQRPWLTMQEPATSRWLTPRCIPAISVRPVARANSISCGNPAACFSSWPNRAFRPPFMIGSNSVAPVAAKCLPRPCPPPSRCPMRSPATYPKGSPPSWPTVTATEGASSSRSSSLSPTSAAKSWKASARFTTSRRLRACSRTAQRHHGEYSVGFRLKSKDQQRRD